MPQRKTAMIAFLAILAFATFGGGCGDDDDPTRPAPTGFEFELTVTGTDGAPLPDLRISRACRLETVAQPLAPSPGGPPDPVENEDPAYAFHPPYPNPVATSMRTGLDVLENIPGREIEIRIVNWRDEDVFTRFTHSLDGINSLIVVWVPQHPNGSWLPDGVYCVGFTVTPMDSSLVLYEQERWTSVLHGEDPYRQEIGRTDADGVFATSDAGIFPPLQGHQPQNGYDDTGAPMEPFRFSDTVAITVTAEPAPGTGDWTYWMTRDVVIEDVPMDLEWVFVPDDSSQVMAPPVEMTTDGPRTELRIVRREQ